MLSLQDDFLHLVFGFLNGGGNGLHGTGISNSITNTNRETVVQQPKVHDLLDVTKQLCTYSWPFFSHDSVN